MRKRQNHLVYGFSFRSQWQYLRVMRFIYAEEVPITNDTHLSRKAAVRMNSLLVD